MRIVGGHFRQQRILYRSAHGQGSGIGALADTNEAFQLQCLSCLVKDKRLLRSTVADHERRLKATEGDQRDGQTAAERHNIQDVHHIEDGRPLVPGAGCPQQILLGWFVATGRFESSVAQQLADCLPTLVSTVWTLRHSSVDIGAALLNERRLWRPNRDSSCFHKADNEILDGRVDG